MKKKTTILSIFLAVFMALALNVGNVKAAATGQDIVNYAKQFLGTPYVWGGIDPSGFDCSGFVQYVYKNKAGINLSRSTYTQINEGTPVLQSNLQPGDLVFTDNLNHVGIYVGNGQMIHSPQDGEVVKISNIYNFYAGRRIIKAPQSFPYVKLDGGGYANYNGSPGLNLIIKDFSPQITKVYAWVDSDTGASWSFAVNPLNSDYTKLYKNTSKVITKRNGGYTFSKGSTYRVKVRAYNDSGQLLAKNQIVLKIPQ